jgi:hypothetical protein
MPIAHPIVAGGTRGYRLRHVGPKLQVWPAPAAAVPTYAVLNQPDMISRPLPSALAPGAPDYQQGQWSGRLQDSGDGQVTFPNSVSSDGVPWRDRFDTFGHNQWFEIYNDAELEQVFCLINPTKSQSQIMISGGDGFLLLKKAFERDLVVVQAPRDVIERATQVWQTLISDNFIPGLPISTGLWSVSATGAGSVDQNGPLTLHNGLSVGSATVQSKVLYPTPTSAWRAVANASTIDMAPTTGSPGTSVVSGAASTGVDNPTYGTDPWTNPGGITGGSPATWNSASSGDTSHYLACSNFHFALPTGSTVVGIVASFRRDGQTVRGFGVQDSSIKLIVGGFIVGIDHAQTSVTWDPLGFPTFATYGSPTDTWGQSLTETDVNASNFGLAIAAFDNGGDFAEVYGPVEITLYYTTASTVSTVFTLSQTESTGDAYSVAVQQFATSAVAVFNAGSNVSLKKPIPTAAAYALLLESDGEWVSAYVNGQFIDGCRRINPYTTALLMAVSLNSAAVSVVSDIVITGMFCDALQPFLMRGADKGDFVLPGSALTYPTGGLHARYFRNADLSNYSGNPALGLLLNHPSRTQALGASGLGEYQNQQDANIDHANTSMVNWAPAGAPVDSSGYQVWFSVVWFGAIWLPLASQSGTFTFTFTADDGVRVWIGATRFGDQIIDSWVEQAVTPYTASIDCGTGNITRGFTPPAGAATSLAGGDGAARDGWYPIKIEYFQGASSAAAQFHFTPPTAYKDPGGTNFTAGADTAVPKTSLSPLGCVDQRYQGQSHYDLAKNTADQFGYQIALEPKRLESGLFPGVLAPRIHVGHDTDIILVPDDAWRNDPMLNYSSQEDASDLAASLFGNGASFQNTASGQLQALVFDPPTQMTSLFDVQGWQDASDVSFASLLNALLNSMLGLRITPWQVVSADPVGRPRESFTWPLPSLLSAMRWRPGDGVRLRARDISVWDTSPRQALVVQRNFTPQGVTGTTVGWANRPRGHLHAQRQMFYSLSRLGRAYQRQRVSLSGTHVTVAGLSGPDILNRSALALLPGDQIIGVWLRVTDNSAFSLFHVYVNGSDRTTQLGGPWTSVPLVLDLTGIAALEIGGANTMYVQLNNTGSASDFKYQLIADVQR